LYGSGGGLYVGGGGPKCGGGLGRACSTAAATPGNRAQFCSLPNEAFAFRAKFFNTPQIDLWLPFSVDLIPLNNSNEGVLEARVQATAHENFTALCASIARVWVAIFEYNVRNNCITTTAAYSRSSPLEALTLNRIPAHNLNEPDKSFSGLPKRQFREILT
jgi:hypothetical protein